MKILVSVKRVTDYEAKLKIAGDGSHLDLTGINMITNPFDEIAVEEALRLKEKHGGEVVVVSVGQAESVQTLRSAMAMGADRAILVKCDKPLDAGMLSSSLKAIVDEEKPDLMIMGKQAIDDDANQVAQMVAEKLSWAQITQAFKVSIDNDVARVVREADGGLETLEVRLPCIITTDLRLNEPRYPSLPGIMKSKSKPLVEKSLEALGVNGDPMLVVKKFEWPSARVAGQMVPDIDTLIEKLRNEAKVI